MNKPLFGIGIDATRHKLLIVTHNQWLQILTELGIVGFTIALAIVACLMRCFIKTKGCNIPEICESLLNLSNGVAVSTFVLLFWGFYENIGFIHANKALFMLMALLRVIHDIACNTIPISAGPAHVNMGTSSKQTV
jgi:O-antigen ligase